jgi:hypothetical protein
MPDGTACPGVAPVPTLLPKQGGVDCDSRLENCAIVLGETLGDSNVAVYNCQHRDRDPHNESKGLRRALTRRCRAGPL